MRRWMCLILICLLLAGCTGQKSVRKELFLMDTVMDLQIWGKDAQTAVNRIDALLRQLDSRWSATNPDSALSKANAGAPAWTAEEQALLKRLEELSQRTDGAFNPCLYALIDAWGFYEDAQHVPTQQEIDAALSDGRMDLGGAIKGYAGQQAVELLEELNVDRAILNLGGNIQTYGSKPDGSAWQIGIQNPDGGGNIGVVSVEGTMSVVTSGDYQRYFEQDGKRYHHIFDPETGWPAASGLRSVTVLCRDGLTADVLSTALFVMGLEEGTALWRQSHDFEAVFLLESGEIWATDGVVLSGCDYEVIEREE